MFKPLALLAPAFIAVAAPVAAQASDTAAVRVGYSDLNLASAEGRAVLDRRLAHAVDRFCDVEPSSGLSRAAAARICRTQFGAEIAAQRSHAIIASTATAPVLAAR